MNARAEESIGIVDAAYALPGSAVDIVDWARDEKVAEDLVERLLQNGCRYFHMGTDCSDAELIGMSIDQLCGGDDRWLADVRYLVHANTQAFSMPAPPTSVLSEISNRYELQLEMAFSIGHVACAGVIHAVDWAQRLLRDDPDARYALVVTADRVFGSAKHRIRQDAGIQSDGGSAILVSRDALRCRIGTISVKNFSRLHEGPNTAQNAAAISRYTWLHTKQLFQTHEERSGFALRDHAALLPINADRHYWLQIAKSVQLPQDKLFLDNIQLRGHACCADFAVNLVDRGFALLEGGEPVLFCGQSNVGAYAAISLLPARRSELSPSVGLENAA